MGFNPRLALYSITREVSMYFATATDTYTYNVDIFRFPQAGQVIGAYANAVRTVSAAGAPQAPAAVEATTNTGIQEISLWKATDADTTATYATSLRAGKRTGDQDSSTGGGVNWRLAGTSAVPGLYALTMESTASRKQFAVDDRVLMHAIAYGATDTERGYKVSLQMDYIIGHESA